MSAARSLRGKGPSRIPLAGASGYDAPAPIVPSCPSYLVSVPCPRCAARAVEAQVFPSGTVGDVVVERGCSACGLPAFSVSQDTQLREAAWDAPRRVCEHGTLDPDDPNDPCMMCAVSL